jgi:predicted enzyme related to lactoylglutathione lyase
MMVNSFFINLTSDQPERLSAFYRDVVQLPKAEGMGDNSYMAGGAVIGIDSHSEIKGRAREPQRILIDFFVDDLKSEQSRLEGSGVKFIRTAGKEYWGGVISTFHDPDGNICQLIEYHPG